MTPGARVQAAIEVLDRIADGVAAERALLGWSRGARYAGSKDRAAVRDHVFDALRMWRSTAALGGGESGRARMIGLLRAQDLDTESFFTGEGHAPPPLSDDEASRVDDEIPLDIPEWLWPEWQASLGDQAVEVAQVLSARAAVFLRVNRLKASRSEAQASLSADGIETESAKLSPTGLRVLSNPRRIAQSTAFQTGLVELQDAASQAVVDHLPLSKGMRVLDYCAGGGGKALAMAALLDGPVEAHDADPDRMSDLPTRAERAKAQVSRVAQISGQYDLVLADAPCSGSGAWRRAPEGKWRLTSERLEELVALQATILTDCAALVRPGGTLAYVTCSVLDCENGQQADRFLDRHPDWTSASVGQFLPNSDGDGLFVACFTRNKP